MLVAARRYFPDGVLSFSWRPAFEHKLTLSAGKKWMLQPGLQLWPSEVADLSHGTLNVSIQILSKSNTFVRRVPP
jgi:hypothetical protein